MVNGVNTNPAQSTGIIPVRPNIDPRLLQAALAELQGQLGGGQSGQLASPATLAPLQAQNVDWSTAQVQSIHDQARQVSEPTEPFWTPGTLSSMLLTARDLPGLLQHGVKGVKIPGGQWLGAQLAKVGPKVLGKAGAQAAGKAIPGITAIFDSMEAVRIQKDPSAGFWKKAMGWTTSALAVVGAGLVLTGVGVPLGGALIGASFATGIVRDSIEPSNPAKTALKGFQGTTSGALLLNAAT